MVRTLVAVALLAMVAVVGSVVSSSRPADATTVGLTSCKFSKFQVFDVQWYISSGELHISGVQAPYTSHPTTHSLTSSELLDTDYFQFVTTSYSEPNPNPNGYVAIGFEQYSSTGTLKLRLDDYGVFQAYGPGFIFYLGEGSWGTVITTSIALDYGGSAVLPVTKDANTDGVISASDMLTYQCQGTPLASPSAPQSVTVTAPTASFTAGDTVPSLTPTVDPVAGLDTQPTCAVYAAADTTFQTPVTITASSPAGSYVTHCSGGVAASGYGTINYVDGAFTVGAAALPPTTTTTTVESTTTTTELAATPVAATVDPPSSNSSGLPLTGQNATIPFALLAIALLSWGGYMALFEWGRRPVPAWVHALRPTRAPSLRSRFVGRTATTVAPTVAAPAPEATPVVAPVVDAPVVAPVVAAPAPIATVALDERERAALERRLALLEGRTDAHSIAWARNLRARLESAGA